MLKILSSGARSALYSSTRLLSTTPTVFSGTPTSSSQEVLTPELRQKIDGMIKADPVVVFMKGTQQQPMCGFSKNLLDFHEVTFKDYNVLEDGELREGIKVYSEWPTIPQVYVKGEFIGGCDIMIQMHKDGEISDLFDKHDIPSKFGETKKTPN